MTLEEKFKLLEPLPPTIPDPEAALLARDAATGTPAVVHVLPGATAANMALIDQVRRLPAEHAAAILHVGDLNGNPCVVSRFLPGDQSLAKWVESLKLPAPPAPAATPASSKPGAFTMMISQVMVNDLMLPQEPSGTVPATTAWSTPSSGHIDVPPALVAPAPAKTDAAPPALPSAEPGEFTRLFSSLPGAAPAPTAAVPPSPQPPPPAPAAQVVPAVEPSVAPEPGEFTKLFGNLAAPKPAPSSPPPPAAPAPAPKPTRTFTPPPNTSDQSAVRFAGLQPKTAPGKFTAMMQAPFAQPAPPAVEPQPPPPVPASVDPPSSKNFTGLFKQPLEAELSAQPTAPPAVSPIAPPDFHEQRTRIAPNFPPPLASPPSRPPARPSPLQSQNEGEFTRLMQGGNRPPSSITPPPASQAPGEFTRMLQGGPLGKPASGISAPPPAPNWSAAPPTAVPDPLFGGGAGQPRKEATGAFVNPVNQNVQPLAQGSSEFTKMFSAPPQQPFGAAPAVKQAPPAPPPPASAAKKSRDRMLVILVVSLLLLAALGIVLFFALDR